MDLSQQNESNGKSSKGATFIKDMTFICSRGERMRVEFNFEGLTIGTNRVKYNNYIRMLTHKKVTIDVAKWKPVLREIKRKHLVDVLVYISYI